MEDCEANPITDIMPNMGKDIDEFRNYKDSDRHSIVEKHYHLMRKNQTLSFVQKMEHFYGNFNHATMSIWEAFEALDKYVDASDPDSSLPNLIHMLQTAEAIRAVGHPDWFQLVGLLHDLGKIQFLFGGDKNQGQQGTADGEQWALGGDTWVVGCKIPDSVVFPEFNKLNEDTHNDKLNSKYGIYEANCGLENLKYAWGHDEYLYQMLKFNECTIPDEGLAMIRYHSLYPWHQKGEYKHLMCENDYKLLDWVLEFNKFDLYTKADKEPNVKELWPYYQSLIDKYFPLKQLKW